MKFGIGVFHENRSSKLEFRENWHGDSHTSPNGVSEFVPYFLYFLTDFDESQCKEISTKFCSALPSFVKIGSLEAVLCLHT